MAAGAAGSTLEFTPTWATASICTAIILISVASQRGIHYAGLWFKAREHSRMLTNALENIKEELMLLGVISLLLAVAQAFTTEICVPRSLIRTMLPCKSHIASQSPPAPSYSYNRKLLQLRRVLADASSDGHCERKGKTPILSATDVHDLHMFIFMLAIIHVSYSLSTVYLGLLKIHAWKPWETESQANDKLSTSQEAKFVRRHIRGSSKLIGVVVAFLQQFGWSVTIEDYHTLRRTFIMTHSVPNNFDFHDYLKSSSGEDVKTVIGISEYFWIYVVVFFLLNVHGWHTYFWISFIPILLLLVLGAKLQYILGTLAVEIMEEPGKPVQLHKNVFWFGTPKLLLHLLHFAIFQNAFELALFFWMWATFGWDSCLMENKTTAILHITSGILILFQCSYTTLPLYALLSRMGACKLEEQSKTSIDNKDDDGVKTVDETRDLEESHMQQEHKETEIY